MSLASHFKKRNSRINVSIVNQRTTTTETSSQLSNTCRSVKSGAKKKTADGGSIKEIESISPFTFDFPANAADADEKGQEEHGVSQKSTSSPFSFNFDAKGETTNISTKALKRRKRSKKKKQYEKSMLEADPPIFTKLDSFIKKTSEVSGGVCSMLKKDEKIKNLDQLRFSQSGDIYEEIETFENMLNTPKSEFAIHIRTPPGFSRNTLKQNRISSKLSNNAMSSKLMAGEESFRKTPGKKIQAIDNDKSSAAQQERKLQFRTSDKGRAMVNRDSLAVHQERSKGKNKEQAEDHNAFSFGFSFDSLLKDYL